MEQEICGKTKTITCLQSLASIRALIINPSTSEKTISVSFETLTQYLQQKDLENHLHHHVLKLLSEFTIHHPDLSRVVFKTIHSYALVSNDIQLKVESLSLLFTVAGHDRSLTSSIGELDEDFVMSLCFSSYVSVRSWILQNAFRFQIRPSLLVTLFLGFLNDPYPYVRRVVLDGLVGLSKSVDSEIRGLIGECYDRAVDLLLDTDVCVRSAAIHVVSEFGQMVSDLTFSEKDWFDAVFVQLCTMVRDMSMEVRNEAFLSLGKIKMVSEDILLQTQSKKILGIIKERKLPGKRTAKKFDLPASNAAGAFVHGLEDEFYEVRSSACKSLGMLIAFSVQFANDAINLLMDMLNDDSVVVRLQTLETMYHMVTCDRLKVQEVHMHLFLGTLVDVNTLIRCAARNVLRFVKLHDMEIFKSSIKGLLTNLEIYPEDEADIFSVLFNMGKNHGKFAASFVKEVSQEIEPSCEGDLSLDNPRVVGILVLAISAPLAHECHACSIPTRVFAYAVPFLGRISLSLRGVATQDTLLAYLSKCSRFTHSSETESFVEDDLFLPVVGGKLPIHNIDNIINHVAPLRQITNETSKVQIKNDLRDLRQTTSAQICQNKATTLLHEEAKDIVNVILRTVAGTWPLIKSGFINEVQKTLRSCKKELATVGKSIGLCSFVSRYIQVIQLLAEIWIHFLPVKKLHNHATGILDHLLEKLDSSLTKLRHGYSGLTKEEDLHILELILFACVLRLSKVEVCCTPNILKRLHSTISDVELLCEDLSVEPSDFVSELRKSFFERGSADDDAFFYHQFPYKGLLDLFTLKQMVFSGRLEHIKAEVDVPGNDSENPLPFIYGFPAGISFQMTLFNISSKDRLWLKMVVNEEENLYQYVFLDFPQIGEYDKIKKVTLSLPFYNSPKAAAFILRACVYKECPSEDVCHLVKGWGGPKRELMVISNEKEIYMVALKGSK